MINEALQITQSPEFRYSRSGLEICTINEHGQRYVSFGDVATAIYEDVVPGDTIKITGYVKSFTWHDSNGEPHTRDDFIIKQWIVV